MDPGRQLALQTVDVGWKVYTTQAVAGGEYADLGLHDTIEGLVVDVAHTATVNTETGEIEPHTSYRLLCWPKLPDGLVWVDATIIDVDNRSFNRADCYKGADRFVQAIEKARRRAPGRPRQPRMWDHTATEYLRYAMALVVAAL